MIKIWLLFAFIAMLVSSFHTIMHKYITNFNENNNDISIAFVFIFAGILSILYLLYNKDKTYTILNSKKINIILLLSFILSIVILSYNYCISNSVKLSSNINYCILIVNFNIIVTTIFSYYLFNQKINKNTLLGILISLIGLSIVICNINN